MQDVRTTLGAAGEQAALGAYLERGYRVIARNWRCRLGELDLVVARGSILVFCEVKTRRGSGYGGGWEAVTPRKQAKVRSLAQLFLIATGAAPPQVRFDVASVSMGRGSAGPGRSGAVEVEIFEDAF
jgi:putative endonuclease